jgi:ADP-ribosylglycohydrolase
MICIRAVVELSKIFEDFMTDLIIEGGDVNTNGAAAVALLGAFLCNTNLPPYWANGLAHKEWLASKISRLTTIVRMGAMSESHSTS